MRLSEVLRALGHEALHVEALGLNEAPDREVWTRARKLDAAVVSKDSDFLAFVFEGGRLVRLRVGNCSNADLYDIVRAAWPSVVARLDEGETMVEVRG